MSSLTALQDGRESYLDSLENVRDAVLQDGVVPGVVDRSHHGQVDGDDGVRQRPRRHGRLEVPGSDGEDAVREAGPTSSSFSGS